MFWLCCVLINKWNIFCDIFNFSSLKTSWKENIIYNKTLFQSRLQTWWHKRVHKWLRGRWHLYHVVPTKQHVPLFAMLNFSIQTSFTKRKVFKFKLVFNLKLILNHILILSFDDVSNRASCLKNEPSTFDLSLVFSNGNLPGQIWNVNDQCRMRLGDGSFFALFSSWRIWGIFCPIIDE